MTKLKEVNQKKYRAVIQYDRDFPKYFDLGDLNKKEANVVYAILGKVQKMDYTMLILEKNLIYSLKLLSPS